MPDTILKSPGAFLDTRTEAEKQRDYSFFEVVAAAAPVVWQEKKKPDGVNMKWGDAVWRKFPEIYQYISGSCVAQTGRKLLGIMYYLRYGNWIDFSATDIYQRRSNKPAAGMGGDDVFKIMQQGVSLNMFVPSDGMTDEQMDAEVVEPPAKMVREIFKLKNRVVLPTGSIELVASTIQETKKGIMCWMYWDFDEYGAVPVVKRAVQPASAEGRHSTPFIDFILGSKKNLPDYPAAWGKKCLVMDESWEPKSGLDAQRVITEDFFKARNYYVAYPIDFVFDEGAASEKPRSRFEKDLSFIPLNARKEISDPARSDAQAAEVIKLQDMLRHEGLFPANIPSTGYYGALTAEKVLAWQKAHSVDSPAALDSLQGRSFGPKSRAIANALYS